MVKALEKKKKKSSKASEEDDEELEITELDNAPDEENDDEEYNNDDDNDDDDDNEDDDDDEEEEEEEEEGDDDDKVWSAAQKAATRKRRANEAARRKGYRKLTTLSGIGKRNTVSNVFSIEDTRRFAKAFPQHANIASYKIDEFVERTRVGHEPLPPSAAAALRPHLDSLARAITNSAALRAVDSGKSRVYASHALAALRGCELEFSYVMPLGLARFAQSVDSRGRLVVGGKPATPGGMPPVPLMNTNEQDKNSHRSEREEIKACASRFKAIAEEALKRKQPGPVAEKKTKKKKKSSAPTAPVVPDEEAVVV